MLKRRAAPPPAPSCRGASRQRGAGLVEILVSIVILTFGLLALAGLQTRMNTAMLESYQRAVALTLLQDMTQRVQVNSANGAAYITTAAGTGSTVATNCTTLASRALIDVCEWSNALLGAQEQNTGGDAVGAMIGARGCVEQIQTADTTSGVCRPAIFRVTVAWQGMSATVAPAVACGPNQYGSDDKLRRAISSRVVVPLPTCS
jgi:type IV pilus assembly protein PilV